MPVIIDEISTEVTVDPAATRGTRETEGGDGAAPAEVQVEELRAVIREILAEEIERYLRQALPLR